MGANHSAHCSCHRSRRTPHGQTTTNSPDTTALAKPSSNSAQLWFYLENTRRYVCYDKASDRILLDGQWSPNSTRYTKRDFLDTFDKHADPQYYTDAAGKPQMQYVLARIPDPDYEDTTTQAALSVQAIMGAPVNMLGGMPSQKQHYAAASQAPNGPIAPASAGYQHTPPPAMVNAGPSPSNPSYQPGPPSIKIKAEKNAWVTVLGLEAVYKESKQAPPEVVIDAAESSRIILDYGVYAGYPAYQTALPNTAINAANGPYPLLLPPEPSVQTITSSTQWPAIDQARQQQSQGLQADVAGPKALPWHQERPRPKALPWYQETTRPTAQLRTERPLEAVRVDSFEGRRRAPSYSYSRSRRRRARSPVYNPFEIPAWSSDDFDWSDSSPVRGYSSRRWR